MDSIFKNAIEDFHRVLLKPNLHSFLNLHLKSVTKYQLLCISRYVDHNNNDFKETINSKGLFMPYKTWLSRGVTNVNINRYAYPLRFKKLQKMGRTKRESGKMAKTKTRRESCKMGRTRRKSGNRKIVDCLKRCLNSDLYPHVLKWIDPSDRSFSILYKNKKSREWDEHHLVFFKELDSCSKIRYEKYKKEQDFYTATKIRCRANMQKLCEDGILKLIGEHKIDPCTRHVYYKFIDISDDNISNPANGEDDWMNAPFFHENTFSNASENETLFETYAGEINLNEEQYKQGIDYNLSNDMSFVNDDQLRNIEQQSAYDLSNDKMDNVNLLQLPNSFSGLVMGNDENFYIISQNHLKDVSLKNDGCLRDELGNASCIVLPLYEGNFDICSSNCSDAFLPIPAVEESTDINIYSNNCSDTFWSIPAVEESTDINTLMKMMDDKVYNDQPIADFKLLCDGNTPNIHNEMDIGQVVKML